MAQYDPYALYQDPFLTNFSVGFQDQNLVGMQLAPLTEVYLPSGKYRVYDRSSWVIFPDGRAPGTVANEVRGAKWSQDTYMVHEHSLQASITDEERQVYANATANAQANIYAQINPEQDATNLVTRAILLRHEKLVADTARNVSNYPAGNKVTLLGTSMWDDYTPNGSNPNSFPNSDPVKDVLTARRTIYRLIRREPNLMIIPWNVWTFIENHPRIVQRFTYFDLTNPQAFAALTGFKGQVVIAESVYNSADNIDATQNITPLWGNDVILAVTDNAPGQNTQTFMKTFGMPYPDGNIRTVDRWREEPRKSDLVRVSMRYDLKTVSPAAGYIIQNATSLAGA